jgi:Arm DNA-binding domain
LSAHAQTGGIFLFQGRSCSSWAARRNNVASSRWREIGKCELLTLEKARDTARAWQDLIKQGIDPAVVADRVRKERERSQANTFEMVAENWFVDTIILKSGRPCGCGQPATAIGGIQYVCRKHQMAVWLSYWEPVPVWSKS